MRPEVELPEDFSGITVEVDEAKASHEDVEARLIALQERFGTLKGVERAVENGDFVSIDLKASIGDDEIDSVTGVSYEVGSGNMLDGLDEALTGMAAEETKSFTAPLAGGDREGEDADVVVTVQSVKVRELPAAGRRLRPAGLASSTPSRSCARTSPSRPSRPRSSSRASRPATRCSSTCSRPSRSRCPTVSSRPR